MVINDKDYKNGPDISPCLISNSFTSFPCNILMWLRLKFMLHKNTNGYITEVPEIWLFSRLRFRIHMGYSCLSRFHKRSKYYKDFFNFCSMTDVRNPVKNLATQ